MSSPRVGCSPSAWLILAERFFPVTKVSEHHRFAVDLHADVVPPTNTSFQDRVKELGGNNVGVLKALEQLDAEPVPVPATQKQEKNQ